MLLLLLGKFTTSNEVFDKVLPYFLLMYLLLKRWHILLQLTKVLGLSHLINCIATPARTILIIGLKNFSWRSVMGSEFISSQLLIIRVI